MRSPGEVLEKIDHLTWYRQTVISAFYVMDMTAREHALLAAFCRTLDNEVQLLRWVFGQVEQTWTDDLSSAIDIQQYFHQLPRTEFAHLPYGKSPSYWAERGITIPRSPGDYVETQFSPR